MKAVFWIFILVVGCSSLPQNPERLPSHALPPDHETRIHRELKGRWGTPPHPGDSAFTPLATGQDAFLARLTSAELADRTLDLQYYIWANDLTGKIMMDYVIRAADRGVRVRILMDDLNQGKFEKVLAILDTHPNIKIRMVNPFAHRGGIHWKDVTRFSKIDHRMHNKVFIADNEIGVVGGRNIGDEYFWASDEMNFSDFDLWAMGPVVQDLSREFDTYWNSDIAYPIASLLPDFHPTAKDLEELKAKTHQAYLEGQSSEYDESLRGILKEHLASNNQLGVYWAKAEVLYDPPEKFSAETSKKNPSLRYQLRPLVNQTQKELILVSPYFIPRSIGMQFFKDMTAKGVESTILTNSLASSDVSSVFAGYKGSRKDLLNAGVHLYELKPTAQKKMPHSKKIGSSSSQSGLHGKVFVFDRQKIFVGSMNLDPRSMELNSEMGVVVNSPELASAFAKNFFETLPDTAFRVSLTDEGDLHWDTIEDGEFLEYTKEPDTSWWKRFKAGLMSIVVPMGEL